MTNVSQIYENPLRKSKGIEKNYDTWYLE
jgi:hypothetical protein